jgi:hypothetical protein
MTECETGVAAAHIEITKNENERIADSPLRRQKHQDTEIIGLILVSFVTWCFALLVREVLWVNTGETRRFKEATAIRYPL